MNRKTAPAILADSMTVEQIELKGFSRSVAELEWLMLILVLLYLFAPGMVVDDRPAVVAAMVCFAAFVIAFRYLNFFTEETRWKIAVETWVMIAFVTWVLWHTGKTESPLLNLYLLVIITSGLTLGKVTTLLEFGLIFATYVYMGELVAIGDSASPMHDLVRSMVHFAPLLLVAYLTTMLASDLHFARSMFKMLSEVDEMTGLLNRRAFGKLLARERLKSSRYQRPLSILLIDADVLKNVNDNHGHEAGDRLIKAIAATVKASLRESDVLARYGGDEFIVLLPETGPAQAREAAERIRKAVERMRFDVHRTRIPVTVSIGLASAPDADGGDEELIDKADRALYRSKQEGRNRVTGY